MPRRVGLLGEATGVKEARRRAGVRGDRGGPGGGYEGCLPSLGRRRRVSRLSVCLGRNGSRGYNSCNRERVHFLLMHAFTTRLLTLLENDPLLPLCPETFPK